MKYEFKSALSAEMRGYLQLQLDAGKSACTIRSTLNEFDRYLVEQKITDKSLKEQVVAEWLASKTITTPTKANILYRIRSFSGYLASLGIHSDFPEIPIYHSSYKPYIFSDAEFAAMIRAADNFEGNITLPHSVYVFPVLLRILYGCGLRLSEGLNIRWKNIDLENGIVAIEHAKNNKQRRVPMDASLTELLRKFHSVACRDESAYLFASPRRKEQPYLKCAFALWFDKILDKAGVVKPTLNPRERGICPHCLRHTFVHKSFLKSEAEGRKFDDTVPFLSEFLGHKSLYETEKYLQSDYTLYKETHKRVNTSIGGLFPKVVF